MFSAGCSVITELLVVFCTGWRMVWGSSADDRYVMLLIASSKVLQRADACVVEYSEGVASSFVGLNL